MIIKRVKQKSSNVHTITYNKRKKRLSVRYKSNPRKVYGYLDVSHNRAIELDGAESKGSFVATVIKRNHEFVVLKD